MKQVILVRNDLKLPKGKMSAQVAHAAVEAEINSPRKKVETWLNEGMKKVVLKVKDLDELKKYEKLARSEKLVTAVIEDRGMTVVEPGTVTCMAIGPDDEEKIDKVTGHLKIM
jgi:PTH2 family peptidyl-tRNA hydrolase